MHIESKNSSLYFRLFERVHGFYLFYLKTFMISPRFKIGDLVRIGKVTRRVYSPRKRYPGWRRPPDNTIRSSTLLYEGKLAIVTQYFHHNQFWRGMDVSPKDNVYICYMQEEAEYFIMCEDEIDEPELYSEEG